MTVIDASVYVSLLKSEDPAYTDSWNWLQSAVEKGIEIFAPAIILAEVAAALSRGVGDTQLAVRAVIELTNSEIVRLKPVSIELGVRAAEIAAEYKVRGCDAVYLAMAEAAGEPLVTLDRQQFERGAAVVKVIRPGT
jgi:predicted nucleic acid-binding protein